MNQKRFQTLHFIFRSWFSMSSVDDDSVPELPPDSPGSSVSSRLMVSNIEGAHISYMCILWIIYHIIWHIIVLQVWPLLKFYMLHDFIFCKINTHPDIRLAIWWLGIEMLFIGEYLLQDEYEELLKHAVVVPNYDPKHLPHTMAEVKGSFPQPTREKLIQIQREEGTVRLSHKTQGLFSLFMHQLYNAPFIYFLSILFCSHIKAKI